jgi:glycosyltransferase involved in cell wall biosynthesis
MACGIAAVVVKAGAFPSVFAEIKEWMFEAGDLDQFVERVLEVASDECDGGEAVGERARRIAVDGFGVQLALDDFLDMYKQIIGGQSC